MKRKLLTISLAFLVVVCIALCLTACVEEHQHDYVEKVVPHTCTENGYTEYKCSCGDIYYDNEVPASHTLDYIEEKDPTCTEAGNTAYYKCSVCDKWFEDAKCETEISDKRSVVIVAEPHEVDFIDEKPATCTEKGHIAYYECSDCHKWFSDANGKVEITDKESIVTDLIPHNLGFVDVKPATCTEKGHTAYYECFECERWFSDVNGESEITDKESVETDLVAHDLKLIDEKPATCTEKGHMAYYECFECERWFSDVNGESEITNSESIEIDIDSNNHKWGEWEIIRESTCIEKGEKKRTCEYSQEHVDTRDIDFKSHNPGYINAKPATCTEKGHTEYYECPICLKWFEDVNAETEIMDKASVEIDVIPHTIGHIDAKPATCTEKGHTAYYKCSVCLKWFSDANGETEIANKESVVTDFIPHSIGLVEAKSATCTEAGNTEYYECSVCLKWFEDANGETEITEKESVVITKLAHQYLNGSCSVCGELKPTDGLVYRNNDKYARLVGIGTATDTDIIIAKEYNGVPVTDVDAYALQNRKSLTSVTIPDSVTSIGEGAFYGCENLTKVYITDLTKWLSISWDSGSGFYSPFSVAYDLYLNNEPITNLVIPDGITTINNYAFNYCGSLKSATIGNDVTSIGEFAFEYCTNLTSVSIENGVTAIGSYSFYCCGTLESISFPDTLTSIDEHAFDSCGKLTSVYITDIAKWCTVSFGSTVSTKHDLYLNNELITDLIIPEGVTSIGKYVFSYCRSLKNVTLSEGVSTIEQNAFLQSSLTSITIPNSVTNIGDSAFENCGNLSSVTIGNGLSIIGNSAFKYCGNLTNINLPEGITHIGSNAFYLCRGLTEITIPNSVTYIGSSAFSSCSKLASITIPDNVIKIGSGAFGGTAFYDNKNNWENGALYIGKHLVAVKGYELGESYIIKEGTITIADHVFWGCSDLTNITIPDSVKHIGNYAFRACKGLTSVTIPEGITSIQGLFYECSGLLSITIPDSVTIIEETSFWGCSSLSSINIGNNVTKIGNIAFKGCTSLTDVYYKGSEEEWNAISIDKTNSILTDATRYYYSETEPALNGDGTAYDGNYWHYVNGEIVVWVK